MTPAAFAVRIRPETTAAPAQAARALWTGLAVFGVAWLLLVLTQYLLPPGCHTRYWGLNLRGMSQFRAHLGLSHLPTLTPQSYSLLFRVSLPMLWSGYALSLLAAWQGAALRVRPLAAAIFTAAVTTAILVPPLLSSDVYAYAAHGRLFVLYGQNPCQTLPIYLADVGDSVAPYLVWNWPTVYGPVWTRIEIAAVGLLHSGGLWPQVVLLKLVQAGALTAAALAGRRITQILSPGRENLTLLAIGLNPLLLLEGPGNGHNDLLMVSFLLVGAMFYLEKKYLPAALFLGLSVGVKMVTLAVLPWVLMDYSRGRSWRQKFGAAFVAIALVLLPSVICYSGLGSGLETLAAVQSRSLYRASPEALAQDQQVFLWLLTHGIQAVLAAPLVTLFQDRVVVLLYALLTVWLWRQRQDGAWMTAWVLLAACAMLLLMGLPFPWYICWFWPLCLLRWDRLHLSLSAACFCLSLTWMSGYGLLFPS